MTKDELIQIFDEVDVVIEKDCKNNLLDKIREYEAEHGQLSQMEALSFCFKEFDHINKVRLYLVLESIFTKS